MVKIDVQSVEIETEGLEIQGKGAPTLNDIVAFEWKQILETIVRKANSVAFLGHDPALEKRVNELIRFAQEWT